MIIVPSNVSAKIDPPSLKGQVVGYTSITSFPAHSSGDLLLAFQHETNVLAGWTAVTTTGNPIVTYKWATSSNETVPSFGSYTAVAVIANAKTGNPVGAFANTASQQLLMQPANPPVPAVAIVQQKTDGTSLRFVYGVAMSANAYKPYWSSEPTGYTSLGSGGEWSSNKISRLLKANATDSNDASPKLGTIYSPGGLDGYGVDSYYYWSCNIEILSN